MHVDGAVVGGGFAVVEALHHGVAADDAAGRAHEHFEDGEFEGSEIDGAAVTEDAAAAGIEADTVYVDADGGGSGVGAAEDGTDAGGELAGIKRLREIVVRAQFQADDSIDVFAARGEHKDGDLALGAKALEDLEAVQTGEHDV